LVKPFMTPMTTMSAATPSATPHTANSEMTAMNDCFRSAKM